MRLVRRRLLRHPRSCGLLVHESSHAGRKAPRSTACPHLIAIATHSGVTMDDRHFDALSRILSTSPTRRSAVWTLASLGVFREGSFDEALAKRKKGNGKGKKHKHKTQPPSPPPCPPGVECCVDTDCPSGGPPQPSRCCGNVCKECCGDEHCTSHIRGVTGNRCCDGHCLECCGNNDAQCTADPFSFGPVCCGSVCKQCCDDADCPPDEFGPQQCWNSDELGSRCYYCLEIGHTCTIYGGGNTDGCCSRNCVPDSPGSRFGHCQPST